MKYYVIGYSNEVMGEVEANDNVEAWSKAGNEFSNILDVRQTKVTNAEDFLYGRKLRKKVLGSPKTFYHVTEESKWERIKKEGLIPMPLNPKIQRATGLKEGIFLGGDEEVVDMMSMGLTDESFDEHPELKEVVLVTLEVIIPVNTTLIEDPEYLAAEETEGAWITDKVIPVENTKFLERHRIKREEWE